MNGTRHPNRFEIARRDWVAEDRIIANCGLIVERPELQAVAGRLAFRLDQMKTMSGRRSQAGFYNGLAGFLEDLVNVEDRL